MNRDSLDYAISILIGLLLWSATAHFAQKREPWDSDLYWSASCPAAVLLSGLIAFGFPQKPWRWALCLMLSQLLVMLAIGLGLGLLPLGFVMLAILAVPAIGMAHLTARLRFRLFS